MFRIVRNPDAYWIGADADRVFLLDGTTLTALRSSDPLRSRCRRYGPGAGDRYAVVVAGRGPADAVPGARPRAEGDGDGPGAAGEALPHGLHAGLLDGEDPGEPEPARVPGQGGQGVGVPGKAAEPQQAVADGGRDLHVDADVPAPADGRRHPARGVREAHPQTGPAGQVRAPARERGDRPAPGVLAHLPQQEPQQGPRGEVLRGPPRRQPRRDRPVRGGDGQRAEHLLAPRGQVVHAVDGRADQATGQGRTGPVRRTRPLRPGPGHGAGRGSGGSPGGRWR